MGDLGDVLAVLRVLLEAAAKAVKGSHSKQVHLAVVGLAQCLQNVAKGNAQSPVPSRSKTQQRTKVNKAKTRGAPS